MKYMGNTIAKYEYDVAQKLSPEAKLGLLVPIRYSQCRVAAQKVSKVAEKHAEWHQYWGWHQCWVALVLDTCGTCGTSVGHGGIETKIKSLHRAGK